MTGAGVFLLLIGLILVGINVLVVILADIRSCLIFLVGLAGLVMIIIGVVFIANETKIVPLMGAYSNIFLKINSYVL